MPRTSAEVVEELWQSALADAGIDADDAILITFDGQPPDGFPGAISWRRHSDIEDPAEMAAMGERLEDLNSDRVRQLRRVVAWTDRTTTGLAAVLRHELEHTHQLELYDAELVDLHRDGVRLIGRHAGGITGNAVIYNQMPMEADANAAGARFARSRFGDDAVDRLVAGKDGDSNTLRPTWDPQPLDTLLERMKEWVAVTGPELAKAFAARHRPSVESS